MMRKYRDQKLDNNILDALSSWCEDRPIYQPRLEAWTLWDIMHNFDSAYFFKLSRLLEKMSAFHGESSSPILGETAGALKELVEEIRTPLHEVDLQMPLFLLDRLIVSLDREQLKEIDLAYLVNELAMRIEDELKTAIVLQIPRERSKYYGEKQLFGLEVSARFPDVSDDLEEASNCIAVDRYTAAVFHVMRVLEVGLQALASKLSISLAKDRNWQSILNDVKGAVNRLPRSSREEKGFLAKCSAAHAHLQAVKDAWRNDVMHPRASYSEYQAIDIIDNSRALMIKIAEIV